MTGYENFKETIKELVQEKFGATYQVKIHNIKKNNGLELNGLSITNDATSVSPTIYLEGFYQDFVEGQSIEKIAIDICNLYQKHISSAPAYTSEDFLDFDKMKERIVYKIINVEKNNELLKEIPYFQFLDLAIVFYCLLDTNADSCASILIYNMHLDLWNVGKEEIYEIAKENTPKLLPSTLESLGDVLLDLMELSGNEDMNLDDLLADDGVQQKMYILSNKSRIHGAASILYPGVLSAFSEKLNSDLYILPSSTDEVIIVKAGTAGRKEFDEMVSEVNSQVETEKVLANHIYIFEKDTQKIVM